MAGGIAALRAGLEALVVEVTKEPEYIRQMDQRNQRLLNVIRHVSKPSAAGLNMVTNNQRYNTHFCGALVKETSDWFTVHHMTQTTGQDSSAEKIDVKEQVIER